MIAVLIQQKQLFI